MRNIKTEVVEALAGIFDNVNDTYPHEWESLPVIQLTEEENRIHEVATCENGLYESQSYVRYRIDIWDKVSTTEATLNTEEKVGVTGVGLYRSSCKDEPDPSQYKHKVIRYEGIINHDNEFIEWPRF